VARRCTGPVVVLGLPRGGVPVAWPVAQALGAPLDVIVVRRLGLPTLPEVAMGALGEGGVRVVDADVVRRGGVTPERFAAVEAAEREVLRRQVHALRHGRAGEPLAGREVVIVDDGVATGSSARAACLVARARGARRVLLAVPVAPVGIAGQFAGVADDVVCVEQPPDFTSVSACYQDFGQVRDREVTACLRRARRRVPAAPAGADPARGGAQGCGRLGVMVLEIAVFTVKPGQADAFAAAYAQARRFIEAAAGCRSVRMTRGVEDPDRFTLLVEWQTLEDHVEGFRGSEAFAQWRALIGPHVDSADVRHSTDLG